MKVQQWPEEDNAMTLTQKMLSKQHLAHKQAPKCEFHVRINNKQEPHLYKSQKISLAK